MAEQRYSRRQRQDLEDLFLYYRQLIFKKEGRIPDDSRIVKILKDIYYGPIPHRNTLRKIKEELAKSRSWWIETDPERLERAKELVRETLTEKLSSLAPNIVVVAGDEENYGREAGRYISRNFIGAGPCSVLIGVGSEVFALSRGWEYFNENVRLVPLVRHQDAPTMKCYSSTSVIEELIRNSPRDFPFKVEIENKLVGLSHAILSASAFQEHRYGWTLFHECKLPKEEREKLGIKYAFGAFPFTENAELVRHKEFERTIKVSWSDLERARNEGMKVCLVAQDDSEDKAKAVLTALKIEPCMIDVVVLGSSLAEIIAKMVEVGSKRRKRVGKERIEG